MFQRLSNGWSLARQSWEVVKLDKELLLFPLISGVACLLVLASFAVPLWNSPYAETILAEEQLPEDPIAYALMFAFYFVNYFVIVFFNSALIACAVIRFEGGNPTLADGLRASMMRLPQIVGWALVSASVGLILRIIESRSERVGEIVSALLGMAWSITTYFVLPVLVIEGVGPVEGVKRSMGIMRKTWGEALTANFGIGLIAFLASIPGILVAVLGVMVLVAGQAVLGGVLIVAGVVLVLLVSLISSALDAILLAALYLYAARGEVPGQFDRNELAAAFGRAATD